MTQILAINVNKGDLICVPYSNRLYPGIYRGVGIAGNIQFYGLSNYTNGGSKDWVRNHFRQGKTIKVDYINRNSEKSIAKLDVDNVEPDLKAWYDEMTFLLKKAGKL